MDIWAWIGVVMALMACYLIVTSLWDAWDNASKQNEKPKKDECCR